MRDTGTQVSCTKCVGCLSLSIVDTSSLRNSDCHFTMQWLYFMVLRNQLNYYHTAFRGLHVLTAAGRFIGCRVPGNPRQSRNDHGPTVSDHCLKVVCTLASIQPVESDNLEMTKARQYPTIVHLLPSGRQPPRTVPIDMIDPRVIPDANLCQALPEQQLNSQQSCERPRNT